MTEKASLHFITSQTNEEEIVREMVGRTLDSMYPHVPQIPGECILKVNHLTCGKAKDVSFQLRRGEILGLFGLMGAGRTSVVRGLFGDSYLKEGSIEVMGQNIKNNSRRMQYETRLLMYLMNENWKG